MLDPQPQPIDRALLAADLERLAEALSRSILPRISPSMRMAAMALGIRPERMVRDVLFRVLDLPDRDLVVLIRAQAARSGAYLGLLPPADATPEVLTALGALVEALA